MPQPRAQATRLAILTAAAEHFARYGYHATSLQRILADSGVTKGALYWHFVSKEALARAVIEEMTARWSALRGHGGDRGLDPLSALLALVDDVVVGLIDDPIAQGGLRLVRELPAPAHQAPGHYGFEREVASLLAQAAQAGLLRDGVDPDRLARQMVAIVAGHWQICDALSAPHQLKQWVDEASQLLIPAIATHDWLTTWRA